MREKARYAILRRRRGFLVFSLLLLAASVVFAPRPAREPVARLGTPAVEPPSVPPADLGPLGERLRQIDEADPAAYGAVVYDPASGETARLGADRTFAAASLAKLPVLYALYRAADEGELSLEEPISMLPTDVQPYGTGVLQGYPPYTTMTLRECAKYLVKQSDNTAWMMLERRLGVARIQADLQEIGADDTDYVALRTTPQDVLLVLEAISDPSRTSPQLSEEMLDLMTDTAFEDRIPASLPEDARVAHKIGSFGSTFSDAGIVYPHGADRPYYIVVMSEGTSEDRARDIIRRSSLAAYGALAD